MSKLKYAKNIEGGWHFYLNNGLAHPMQVVKEFDNLQKENELLRQVAIEAERYLEADGSESAQCLWEAIDKLKEQKC